MAYVYRHIRKDTSEVFYIGVGIREAYRRATTIVRRNQHWKNIVAKTDWYAEIMIDGVSFEYAKIKEVEFIKLYGRKDLGKGTLVNMTDGGDGSTGRPVTDETKNKLSIFNKGKTLSDEHKLNISISNKGKFFSESTLTKMSVAKKGRKQSMETVDKRRIKLIGNKSNTGKKLPLAQREKMAASQKLRRQKEFLTEK